jgi:6-phosphogluconolactonase
LVLSEDHRFLFAVNAGSNQISVFKVGDNELELASVISSEGRYPVSLALKHNLLYVLNAGGDGNVTAFSIGRHGTLKPIPNSTRSLHANTPDVGLQPHELRSPAQLQFSPDGEWLVVDDKNLDSRGTIQLFSVKENGLLSETPVITTSPDALPFGFTFDRRGHLLMTEAFNNAVSSYNIGKDGNLTAISLSVKNGQVAPCWIDGTKQFTYVTNTFGDTLTGYRIERNGELTLLDASGVTVAFPAGHAPSDIKVSSDEHFLHVIKSGAGTVASFRINPSNGSLTLTSEIPVFPALSGMQGLAAE